jgi:hypothetical protein
MNNEPVAWKVIETDDEGSFTTFTEVEPVWADNAIPLYTHPAKHLSLQKVDGELVAVTYTDDEHRIVEVLWERPPEKTLTDEEITQVFDECYPNNADGDVVTLIDFARAILRKAQEK